MEFILICDNETSKQRDNIDDNRRDNWSSFYVSLTDQRRLLFMGV